MNKSKEEIEKEQEKKDIRKRNFRIAAFLLVGLGIIILMPFLFTLPALFGKGYGTNTGEIGDTIGGLSAPFINLLGAILVYLSFTEQKRANEIQIKTLREEQERVDGQNLFISFENDFLDIRNGIESLGYEEIYERGNSVFSKLSKGTKIITPESVVEEYFRLTSYKEESKNFGDYNPKVTYLLTRLKNLHFRIINSNVKDKEILIENIILYYNILLSTIIAEYVYKIKENKKVHDILLYLHEKIGGNKIPEELAS